MVTKQEELQKQQEARNFIGRKGTLYVNSLATEEERKYFEGILYCSGIPILSFISYMASSVNSY